jgi:hypothetical protein
LIKILLMCGIALSGMLSCSSQRKTPAANATESAAVPYDPRSFTATELLGPKIKWTIRSVTSYDERSTCFRIEVKPSTAVLLESKLCGVYAHPGFSRSAAPTVLGIASTETEYSLLLFNPGRSPISIRGNHTEFKIREFLSVEADRGDPILSLSATRFRCSIDPTLMAGCLSGRLAEETAPAT